ncbi:MAG: hypothetical protein ING52_12595 [Burkholderiales bacterium]|nr:hypothetical protein [Burkholderiales bacterium]
MLLPASASATEEVFLVDLREYRDHRALDDFVFHRGNPQRALFAIGFRDEPSPDGLRPVRATLNSLVQAAQVALKARLVVQPCHAIHSGCGTALERQERIPQQVDRDMVQQRGKSLLLPPPCSVAYTVQPL